MCLTLAQLAPSVRQHIRLNDREREVTDCWEWTGPTITADDQVEPRCVLTETDATENAAHVVWAAMHRTSIYRAPQLRRPPTCEALCVSPYHLDKGRI